MCRRTLTTLIIVMAMTAGAALAQQPPQTPAPTPPARTRPTTPAPRVVPVPRATTPLYGDEQPTPLTMKVARNAHVAVTSQRVNVRINGVDGDTLEAI